MDINLEYDNLALAAPQSFRNGIQVAANGFDALFYDNVTRNITVGYGEIDGTPEASGGASAGPATGVFSAYSTVRAWLAANTAANVAGGVVALPTGSSIQGQSSVAVWAAQEKLMGLLPTNDAAVDGDCHGHFDEHAHWRCAA
jgi:hypothetical protein